jgi:CheY-like chemotaxis protein
MATEATENAPVKDVPIEVPNCNGDRASVLLVEDEDATRDALAAYLDKRGYRVVAAANAQEAWQSLEAVQADHFDILLTDVVMPGMSGAELAARFRARHPDGKVVFMSGYADDVLMQSGVHQSQTILLAKPFRLSDLGNELNKVLADRQGAIVGIAHEQPQSRSLPMQN